MNPEMLPASKLLTSATAETGFIAINKIPFLPLEEK